MTRVRPVGGGAGRPGGDAPAAGPKGSRSRSAAAVSAGRSVWEYAPSVSRTSLYRANVWCSFRPTPALPSTVTERVEVGVERPVGAFDLVRRARRRPA